MSAKLLTPEIPQQVPAKLEVAQQNQAKHYNKVAKPLSPLKRGDSVYLAAQSGALALASS